MRERLTVLPGALTGQDRNLAREVEVTESQVQKSFLLAEERSSGGLKPCFHEASGTAEAVPFQTDF